MNIIIRVRNNSDERRDELFVGDNKASSVPLPLGKTPLRSVRVEAHYILKRCRFGLNYSGCFM